MIEIFEIFWLAKIELRVIILAVLIGSCFLYLQKQQKKEKKKNNKRG